MIETALVTDPGQVRGNVTSSESLDWYPLMIRSLNYCQGGSSNHNTSQEHNGFLISGSDGVIHVRMLVLSRSAFFPEFIAVKLERVVFLSHLTQDPKTVLSMDYHIGRTRDLWATGHKMVGYSFG